MTRLNRAVKIRDIIVNSKSAERSWDDQTGMRRLTIKTSDWEASLNTPFNPLITDDVATPSYLHALLRANAQKPLDNLLDLWLPGLGKVLSLEWSDDEANLISMKRGDWEATLFGLPPYDSKRSSKV
tara:strand:- start:1531 stop:1911 length:381 start_codon:yes stop_codon:yes gene_type:complete